MSLPFTVPLMGTPPPSDDRSMVPWRFDPDSVQVMVNVPWKSPLYCPDQVPARSPPAAGLLVGDDPGGDEVAVAGVVDGAPVVGVPVEPVAPLPQAAVMTATVSNAPSRVAFDGRLDRERLCEIGDAITTFPFPTQGLEREGSY